MIKPLKNMEKIVALNDLRLKMNYYAEQVKDGNSFVIVKRSNPLFKIVPIESEDKWEEVIDFTKINKGGINIDDILQRL